MNDNKTIFVPVSLFRFRKPLRHWEMWPGKIYDDKEEAKKALQRTIGKATAMGAVEAFTDIMTIIYDPAEPEEGRTEHEAF